MTGKWRAAAISILVALLPCTDGGAQDIGASGIGREEGCSVLGQLQAAIRSGDVAAITALVEFPLSVYQGQRKSVIPDEDAFRSRYSSIFTVAVRDAVLKQDCASLFGNWRGVMIGRGQVWISAICPGAKPARCESSRVRVVTINIDAPPPP